MYNLIRHSDRERFQFTVGFFAENQYVQKYQDLNVNVEIIPCIPPVKNGIVLLRKAINWYNREYQLEKYLLSFIRKRRFDFVFMNNSIFESKNFIRTANRSGLPIVIWERGISKYSRENVESSERVEASVAMSDAILENIHKHQFKSRIITRIYDGVDPTLFEGPFDRIAIKKDLKIPIDSKVIGILGNVRVWKGQKYFIEAFKYLAPTYPDLYGLIIGGWSDMDHEYLGSLRRAVTEAGLTDRIRFLGYRKDTPSLLSVLDVFVHASIEPEPFGMVLPEAMAAKVPVIATNFGGPLEIFDAGKCGALVPPEDGRAIAEECIKYFSDDAYRRNIIDKAYKRLLDKFHIRTTVKQVEQLLDKISLKHINNK
jgi:glycosyltransferase involved in cell wall biosynthesis